MASVGRESSILNLSEPLTLSFEQIQQAKEAAIQMLTNESSKEALVSLLEGLKLEAKEVKVERVVAVDSEEICFDDSSVDLAISPPNSEAPKDVASAPF